MFFVILQFHSLLHNSAHPLPVFFRFEHSEQSFFCRLVFLPNNSTHNNHRNVNLDAVRISLSEVAQQTPHLFWRLLRLFDRWLRFFSNIIENSVYLLFIFLTFLLALFILICFIIFFLFFGILCLLRYSLPDGLSNLVAHRVISLQFIQMSKIVFKINVFRFHFGCFFEKFQSLMVTMKGF